MVETTIDNSVKIHSLLLDTWLVLPDKLSPEQHLKLAQNRKHQTCNDTVRDKDIKLDELSLDKLFAALPNPTPAGPIFKPFFI